VYVAVSVDICWGHLLFLWTGLGGSRGHLLFLWTELIGPRGNLLNLWAGLGGPRGDFEFCKYIKITDHLRKACWFFF